MQISLPFIENDKSNINYNKIHRDQATFKSGLSKEVHNWFRLTPSFGPDLVYQILQDFEYSDNSIVLDPFAGAGTTLIECQLLNIKSYGFEINPFLYFVGNTSCWWDLEINNLQIITQDIISLHGKLKKQFSDISCENLPYDLPPIHNIYRWWRPDILKDLLILKHSIVEACSSFSASYKDFFHLCLAGVLIPDLTNVTLGKLQLHFKNRENDIMNVLATYTKHLNLMLDSIKKVSSLDINNHAQLFHVDSTQLEKINIPDSIDFVITSPPYPNRYSYVWNTRPYLYFFDMFSSPKQASDLDKKTIGGTWGTATSCISKGVVEPYSKAIEKHVSPVVERIRQNDNLMANYVMKYFNLLSKQIEQMDKFLSKDAKVAYVVGNSEIKGVYVETDVLLSKIFESQNYSKIYMNRFRKRNSGQDLFETIVYAEK
ncbi:MAG: site-specific DNA-methyltransferase [Porphyromonadaceae bacterium]|nr:site-specific DNA-methyltransferase [Porphyromonadaceae bacterium]